MIDRKVVSAFLISCREIRSSDSTRRKEPVGTFPDLTASRNLPSEPSETFAPL
jgi:hypothetical protein